MHTQLNTYLHLVPIFLSLLLIKYISSPHICIQSCLQVLIIRSSNLIGGGRFASAVNSLIPKHSMKHLGTIVMAEDWLTVGTS